MSAPVTGAARTSPRRERILEAAAELFAGRGYHAVGMADIGGAAGITGPGIYRHFESKAAILVDLFERAIDRVQREADNARPRGADPAEVLAALVRAHALFAVEERGLVAIYAGEVHNLPEQDARRLRHKQRGFVERWIGALSALRPEWDEAEVRVRVQAAFGVLHALPDPGTRIAPERELALRVAMTEAVLTTPA